MGMPEPEDVRGVAALCVAHPHLIGQIVEAGGVSVEHVSVAHLDPGPKLEHEPPALSLRVGGRGTLRYPSRMIFRALARGW